MKKFIFLMIFICFLVSCFDEESQEIKTFVKSTAPELLIKIDNLSHTIGEVETKIKKLTLLQNHFPEHTQITQPRIDKWTQVHSQLKQTQTDIQFQIERAFVMYKTDQEIEGSQKFTTTVQTLIEKADDALSMAKNVATVVEESANH